MTKLEIIGFDISNWVRAARIACEEKGVAYELTADGMSSAKDLKSAKHLALHPFGRMPAMRHGDVALFETAAICRYVDTMFDGPRLVPADPIEAARMEQWISAMIDYVSRPIMGSFVIPYLFPRTADGKPNRAIIDAAIPDIRNCLAILDRALAAGPFLHGATPYLDDFILLPMEDALTVTPEGPGAPGGGAQCRAPPRGVRRAAKLWRHDTAAVSPSGLGTFCLGGEAFLRRSTRPGSLPAEFPCPHNPAPGLPWRNLGWGLESQGFPAPALSPIRPT